MGKIYLVDSENVGDIWVPLLVSSQEDDEVLVFYTTKSPHMNYENVRMLKETEKEADFIKCFEGSNALDFQLVSELGYRLSQNAAREYVIVSNDTGFDAAVRYWSARKMPVSRLSGKECHRMLTEKKQRVAKESGAAAEPEQEQSRAAGSEAEAEQVWETGQEAEAERGREQSRKPRSSKKSEPSKAGGKAGESGKPEASGKAGNAETSGKAEVIGKAEDAEKSGKAEPTEKAGLAGESGKPEVIGKAEDAETSGKAEVTGKAEDAETSGKPEVTGKAEDAETSEKSESAEKAGLAEKSGKAEPAVRAFHVHLPRRSRKTRFRVRPDTAQYPAGSSAADPCSPHVPSTYFPMQYHRDCIENTDESIHPYILIHWDR